jgi:hypothetical protein
VDRALVDVIGRFIGGIFQHLALGRGVQKVRVDRKRRLAAFVLGDGDLVLFGELDQLGAAGQVPFAPGRDDLDLGVERIGAKLEPHLVVALAGRAVADGVGAGFGRDLDQPLGDQGPRDGGAQKVKPLVKRVGAEHREDEVAHEFLAQVLDVDVGDAQHLGLLARGLQFLPWPRSAVKVTTSQPYSVWSHFRMIEVSRPPE